MSAPSFTLKVFHPSIDPRKITEELGLPPTTSWAAGGGKSESFWQTRLLGNETGRGDMNTALQDIAARFQHYRFFVEEMRDGGGRVEVAVSGAAGTIDPALVERFKDLHIRLILA